MAVSLEARFILLELAAVGEAAGGLREVDFGVEDAGLAVGLVAEERAVGVDDCRRCG